jgi:hypothetical protein
MFSVYVIALCIHDVLPNSATAEVVSGPPIRQFVDGLSPLPGPGAFPTYVSLVTVSSLSR